MKKHVIALTILGLLLAACASPTPAPTVIPLPSASATATEIPTNTPTVPFTPTITFTPTVTNTPTSTASSIPTATPTPSPTSVPTETPAPTTTPTVAPTATPTPIPTAIQTAVPTEISTQGAAATTGNVQVSEVKQVGTGSAQPDEYVEIQNLETFPIQLQGWTLQDASAHIFTFPPYLIQPGQFCRIYTNEIHADTCGFSYRNSAPIWNNDGDCAYLKDSSNKDINSKCY